MFVELEMASELIQLDSVWPGNFLDQKLQDRTTTTLSTTYSRVLEIGVHVLPWSYEPCARCTQKEQATTWGILLEIQFDP